ncbi:MAG TPA: hypothetical protein VF179_25645 [Thermoanaerobaculia bacterium]|nr:hypothetical protein [Thermoanaerobaculia bacterium]
MGLRFRDLMMDVGVECMAGPVPPGCGCTQTAHAPQCTKGSQNPNPRPNCPKPSAGKPPKRLDGLGLLREQLLYQLRSELRG